MASRKRRQSWASQAALQALVRYGPEMSGIRELTNQASQDYGVGVRQARGTSAGIISAVDQTRPQVAKLYDQAGLDQARTASLVSNDIAGLSGVANSIRAGAQLEASTQVNNLRTARTEALTDLSSRRVAAKEGEKFAVQNARSQFVSEMRKILGRKQDLRGERGAFEASIIAQLAEADRAMRHDSWKVRTNNRQSERNSQRSAGIDPSTGRPIPGGKLDPKGPGGKNGATLAQHQSWQTAIGEIGNFAQKYKGKMPRAQIVQKLKTGRDKQTIYVDPQTRQPVPDKTPGAIKVVLGKIPSFKPDVRMTAALDMVLNGFISRNTFQQLRKLGFDPERLGLKTRKQWEAENRGRPVPNRPPLAPGPGGQQYRPN